MSRNSGLNLNQPHPEGPLEPDQLICFEVLNPGAQPGLKRRYCEQLPRGCCHAQISDLFKMTLFASSGRKSAQERTPDRRLVSSQDPSLYHLFSGGTSCARPRRGTPIFRPTTKPRRSSRCWPTSGLISWSWTFSGNPET